MQQQRKRGRLRITTSSLFFKMSPNALFIHFFSHLWLYTRDRAAWKWAKTFLIPVLNSHFQGQADVNKSNKTAK